MADVIEELLEAVRRRLTALAPAGSEHASVMAHLRSLAAVHPESFAHAEMIPVPDFPRELGVAFAVCSPECGAREFIVDGSTQECQRCGQLMFRLAVANYRLEHTE